MKMPLTDTTESLDLNQFDVDNASDEELQEAFAKGILKPGLNIVEEKVSRVPINNVIAMKAKLQDTRLRLNWFERLDVTVERSNDTSEDKREDDFKRECSFYKQAQLALTTILPKLRSLGIPLERPKDYYAEMAKTDDHMKKVREKILSIHVGKQKQERARQMREQRKHSVQIQKDVVNSRLEQKRVLADAVKKFKKGAKTDLENILKDKKSSKPRDRKAATRKRAYRDAKYGYGGKKRGSKRNTAESTAGIKPKKRPFVGSTKTKGGKKQRPGKNKRMQKRK